MVVASALTELNDDILDLSDVAITGLTQTGTGNIVANVTLNNNVLTVSMGNVSFDIASLQEIDALFSSGGGSGSGSAS